MTEAEWLSSADPWEMLRGRSISDRKAMLYVRACCYALSEELGRDADACIEMGSGPAKNPGGWALCWAGDQGTPSRIYRATILRDIIGNPYRRQRCTGPNNRFGCSKVGPTDTYDPEHDALYDAAISPQFVADEKSGGKATRYTPIMGGRIYQLLSEIYDNQDFALLPVVADMLQDHDAANHVILDHLRSAGPHVRGCWAVDLLLGEK